MQNMQIMLKFLYLENFCGYEDTILDFTDGNNGVNAFNVFFGENGVGKTTVMKAMEILGNASRYENRDLTTLFRKLVHSEDYDPSYQLLKEDKKVQTAPPAKKMLIHGVFATTSGDKEVVVNNHQVLKNELPSQNCGHTYRMDADHPSNRQKFQVANDHYADKFLEIARAVYGFDCEFDKLTTHITDHKTQENRMDFFTDFVIIKSRNNKNIRVHFKSMSDGETKVAKMLELLSDARYMDNVNIILVDNIEMHIYYKRHAKLVDSLLRVFPGKQFITTTHSGYLIDHIRNNYNNKWLFDLEEIHNIKKKY